MKNKITRNLSALVLSFRMKSKIASLAFLLVLSSGTKLFAENPPDEGMWLPILVERLNYVDMEKMGLHLTVQELYDINHSSLKDAIVGLSSGGAASGGFFSRQKLSRAKVCCLPTTIADTMQCKTIAPPNTIILPMDSGQCQKMKNCPMKIFVLHSWFEWKMSQILSSPSFQIR